VIDDDVKNIPLSVVKSEILNKSDDLVYEDRLYVLKILIQHVGKNKIIKNGDGSRVNIDDISETIIRKIHYIIINKLQIQKKNLI
jgi:hypothetical protein